MRIHLSAVVVSGLVMLAWPMAAWGQFQNRTGSTPTFGGGSFGSSAGGRGVSAASAGVPSLSGAAQLSSGDRFVRGARQPGAFVGADSSDTREFVGQVGATTGRARSAARGSTRGSSARRGQTANRNRTTGRGAEIRAAIRLGFRYPAPTAVHLSSALASRLERSTRIQAQSPLEVAVGSGTATLRGTVATADDRRLAEQLVRLEPGIRQVKNELIVAAGPGATPAASSPILSAPSLEASPPPPAGQQSPQASPAARAPAGQESAPGAAAGAEP